MSVAVVTGATKNIGLAIAERLAAAGHGVVVNGRTREAVDAAVDRLRSGGATTLGHVGDVADPDHVEDLFATAERELGDVAILVNNAGIRCHGPLVDTQVEDWRRVLDVVLTGSFLTTRRALPRMAAAGWGRIVNLAGVSAQSGASGRVAVVAAKSGIIGLTKASAHEAASLGVTVNAISPGFIDTARSPSLGDNDVANAHYERGRDVPVGRAGSPADIAAACAFLCSEEAGYITGQIIAANGGAYM